MSKRRDKEPAFGLGFELHRGNRRRRRGISDNLLALKEAGICVFILYVLPTNKYTSMNQEKLDLVKRCTIERSSMSIKLAICCSAVKNVKLRTRVSVKAIVCLSE